ncbi:MAG: beta-phosphoglucomutase family hydrolase [Anaerolineales bacterium]|nr:beta-phosphoglucomutase family hydrolase [Anaerolineales bacterium]MDW8278960.1 beta-phosphoglucomutase family hydrolase [Anaerolineales bacterium]
MNYNALIFDMDGTLVHNMPIHNQAWSDTLAEAGIQIDLEEFNRLTTGKKNGEILRLMLGAHISEQEIAFWSARKEALYRERFACCREPLPGLLDFLEQAHALNLPMAVATAAPPENVKFILDEMDLRRHFRAVIGAQDVRNGKPDPEIFLKAAQTLEVRPEACLVFEDALAGIEAAARAGMDAVFLCTTLPAREVEGLPHVLRAVPDFTHLDLPALLG